MTKNQLNLFQVALSAIALIAGGILHLSGMPDPMDGLRQACRLPIRSAKRWWVFGG
jgi:hypothetical protein